MIHMQPIHLYFLWYLHVHIWPFHITPQFWLITYPSKPLVFDAPIILRGRNLIFVISSLLPYTVLSSRLTTSLFMRSVCLSIYSSLHFFLNATKHGRYRRCHRSFSWYSLLFLTFLLIQDPLTYAIPGTNHGLFKYRTQCNASRQKHHLKVSIGNITVNHPNSQKIRDTPPAWHRSR